MAGEDATRFRREMRRVTALPLARPEDLYLWLPNKPGPSRLRKDDAEIRQLLARAEEHMSLERATVLVRQATELADRRLLQAAWPEMTAHHMRLLGHGPNEESKPRNRSCALAQVPQDAVTTLFAALRYLLSL